tara:strand:+ start:469 stop:1020 length:552 start_codon:yes stop_codon:yes gene_type:complete
MKKFRIFTYLLTFVLLTSSCNSIRVYSDFDSEINFENYSSFAFYKKGIDNVEISDIDKKRILKSIEKNLVAKGMSVSENPDILINISTKSSENIYIDNSYYSPYYSGWYPYYYGRNYRRVSHTTSEGVLYIDLIDTNSKQLVWQGKGIGFLSSNSSDRDALVDNYVTKILSVFPPQVEATVNQ